ncbi:hypothetical protein BGX23_005638 [Mortierella sp. AD031]|nr:hypothetical protein BGX23_005638 [Mortierella sp. AD031]
MPSVINNHFSTTSTPSELDLLSDDATPSYYSRSLNSNQQDNRPIQDLKDRRRRQWLEPEDEFSVPIHTESPLITKSPLDMSSFLLNYRAMRRSVEIMTPPPSPSSNKNHSSSDSSLVCSKGVLEPIPNTAHSSIPISNTAVPHTPLNIAL